MLKTWWLAEPIYWTFVAFLVMLLVTRELLGPLQDERSLRWKRMVTSITVPLLALFLIYVAVQVANIISQMLAQA
jgi:hypothetical protein